jgi:hypothetical protein
MIHSFVRNAFLGIAAAVVGGGVLPACSDSGARPPSLREDRFDASTSTAIDAGTIDATTTSEAAADTSTTTTKDSATPIDSSVGGADAASEAGDSSGPGSCTDTVKNGNESDVDCGGSCPQCKNGQYCYTSTDCESASCSTDRLCIAPTCADGAKNGNETDTDCGGPNCSVKCGDFKACKAASDCVSGVCLNNACQPASCSDTVKNGDESDLNCGGKTCPACGIGKFCSANSDCVSNNCDLRPGPTQNWCVCPDRMVISPLNGAEGTFCIDATEVTKADYLSFWSAGQSPTIQPPYCQWNVNFTPSDSWPPVGPLQLGEPVQYVDWCDAYAYCKWRNKSLCGNITTGDSNPPASSADGKQSQWYDACSGNGASPFPYGTAYHGDYCDGPPTPPLTDGGLPAVRTVVDYDKDGVFVDIPLSQCAGKAFGLYDMSGDVAEWENSCDASTGAADTCLIRGGSIASSTSDDVNCAAAVPTPRNTQSPAIGFRCCLN